MVDTAPTLMAGDGPVKPTAPAGKRGMVGVAACLALASQPVRSATSTAHLNRILLVDSGQRQPGGPGQRIFVGFLRAMLRHLNERQLGENRRAALNSRSWVSAPEAARVRAASPAPGMSACRPDVMIAGRDCLFEGAGLPREITRRPVAPINGGAAPGHGAQGRCMVGRRGLVVKRRSARV